MSSIIPVINLREIQSSQTLRALDSACRNWGVFQLVGHGLDPRATGRLFESMHAFFAQARDCKLAISRTRDNPWGYYDQERTGNTLDYKQVYDYGPADALKLQPRWPEQQPGFKTAVLEYYAACERLSFSLLEAIASNLGVSPAQLRQSFAPSHTSFLRLNYYPGQPQRVGSPAAEKAMGVNAHTDAGALTLLSVDQAPGLEIWNAQRWLPVQASDGALVINIGDVVQVWSNDRYRAPLHRVTGSGRGERYSTPFFLNPAYSANYAPLDSTVDSGNPARYRPINWGEFRALRALGDYADYGEEVQLKQYRING